MSATRSALLRRLPIPSCDDLMTAVANGQPACDALATRFAPWGLADAVPQIVMNALDPLLVETVLGPVHSRRWLPLLREHYRQVKHSYPGDFADVEALLAPAAGVVDAVHRACRRGFLRRRQGCPRPGRTGCGRAGSQAFSARVGRRSAPQALFGPCGSRRRCRRRQPGCDHGRAGCPSAHGRSGGSGPACRRHASSARSSGALGAFSAPLHDGSSSVRPTGGCADSPVDFFPVRLFQGSRPRSSGTDFDAGGSAGGRFEGLSGCSRPRRFGGLDRKGQPRRPGPAARRGGRSVPGGGSRTPACVGPADRPRPGQRLAQLVAFPRPCSTGPRATAIEALPSARSLCCVVPPESHQAVSRPVCEEDGACSASGSASSGRGAGLS